MFFGKKACVSHPIRTLMKQIFALASLAFTAALPGSGLQGTDDTSTKHHDYWRGRR